MLDFPVLRRTSVRPARGTPKTQLLKYQVVAFLFLPFLGLFREMFGSMQKNGCFAFSQAKNLASLKMKSVRALHI